MAIKKFGQSESFEVFRGKEADIVNRHMQRVGKAVSEFDQGELQSLNEELESVRESKESPKSQTKEPQDAATDKDETSSDKTGSQDKKNDA